MQALRTLCLGETRTQPGWLRALISLSDDAYSMDILSQSGMHERVETDWPRTFVFYLFSPSHVLAIFHMKRQKHMSFVNLK